jgi:hypothetical protein
VQTLERKIDGYEAKLSLLSATVSGLVDTTRHPLNFGPAQAQSASQELKRLQQEIRLLREEEKSDDAKDAHHSRGIDELKQRLSQLIFREQAEDESYSNQRHAYQLGGIGVGAIVMLYVWVSSKRQIRVRTRPSRSSGTGGNMLAPSDDFVSGEDIGMGEPRSDSSGQDSRPSSIRMRTLRKELISRRSRSGFRRELDEGLNGSYVPGHRSRDFSSDRSSSFRRSTPRASHSGDAVHKGSPSSKAVLESGSALVSPYERDTVDVRADRRRADSVRTSQVSSSSTRRRVGARSGSPEPAGPRSTVREIASPRMLVHVGNDVVKAHMTPPTTDAGSKTAHRFDA